MPSNDQARAARQRALLDRDVNRSIYIEEMQCTPDLLELEDNIRASLRMHLADNYPVAVFDHFISTCSLRPSGDSELDKAGVVIAYLWGDVINIWADMNHSRGWLTHLVWHPEDVHLPERLQLVIQRFERDVPDTGSGLEPGMHDLGL